MSQEMAQVTSWGVESMTRTLGTGVGHAATRSMLASILWLRETGPDPPVELANAGSGLEDNRDQGSLKEKHPAPPCKRSGQKNGARPCASNDATRLKASHPTQGLISD